MGIDSGYGIGSLKTGVCTTATRPAAPFVGQTIYDTTVATTLVWNGSAWIGSAGKVLQVVNAVYSTETTTTSSSYVTAGLTASITPSSTTSKIWAMCTGAIGNTGAGYIRVTLFRGTVAGTNLAPDYLTNTYNLNPVPFAVNAYDSPSTTSATTYTLAMKVTGATGYIQSGSATSSLTLMEISA